MNQKHFNKLWDSNSRSERYDGSRLFACLKGASTIHFQDFNAEVLRCLTIPNVYVNLQNARERLGRHCDGPVTPTRTTSLSPDVHFYASDWGDLHTLLSVVGENQIGAI